MRRLLAATFAAVVLFAVLPAAPGDAERGVATPTDAAEDVVVGD